MLKKITSISNPFVKNLLHLEKANERKEQNLIIIEGIREIKLAIIAGYKVETILFCPELLDENTLKEIISESKHNIELIEISNEVFNKLAYRKDSGGIIATSRPLNLTLEKIKLTANPLILVLETVEKPGNLGAMLRTADAANLDAVIVCDNQTDIYNPNVIRSSVGCLFTNQVVACTSEQAIKWLKSNQIKIFSTALTGTKNYHTSDFNQSAAIVMGSEAFGLSKIWLHESDEIIKIPMNGKIDSMNVSVSAAIVIFEALRQREINK